MTSITGKRTRWTRLLRFRLSSLLMLLTVFSILMGIWALNVQPYREQASALAFIGKECNANFAFETRAAIGPNWQRWLVAQLLGADQFVEVISVDLRSADASAQVLRFLAKLRFLQSLYLDRTKMDDSILASMFRLKKLKRLSLSYTPVTDSGLKYLHQHPELEELYLTGTAVSDDGIPALSQVTTLRKLYIRWSALTIAGIETLSRNCPNCGIHSHNLPPQGESIAVHKF